MLYDDSISVKEIHINIDVYIDNVKQLLYNR